jgi:hypothetical protein
MPRGAGLPGSEMDKEIARSIIETARAYDKRLVDMIPLVKQDSTSEESKRYVRAVGHVIGDMTYEVFEPLFKEHPDLEPDDLKIDREEPAR